MRCRHLLATLLFASLPALAHAADADGDGIPEGIDCDDTDPDIYPGAPETCDDGIDQDCIDNSCVTDEDGEEDCAGGDRLSDVDGDGFANDRCGGDDCDDRDATLRPVDDDGDGFTSCGGDCDDADAAVDPVDDDGDGTHECAGDCDDAEADIGPTRDEVCGDALDNDCDGTPDNVDTDGDGAFSADCGGDDCDDGDASFSPLSPEAGAVCNDSLDNDCDGLADDGDADCFEAPEADAGRNVQDRYLGGTTVVALDGSGTTDFNGGDVLTYTWTVTPQGDFPGVAWELAADPASPFAFLRFQAEGGSEATEWSFLATLTVSDGVAETEDDTASITVRFWRPDYVPPKGCAQGGSAPRTALALLVLPGALLLRRRRAAA